MKEILNKIYQNPVDAGMCDLCSLKFSALTESCLYCKVFHDFMKKKENKKNEN